MNIRVRVAPDRLQLFDPGSGHEALDPDANLVQGLRALYVQRTSAYVYQLQAAEPTDPSDKRASARSEFPSLDTSDDDIGTIVFDGDLLQTLFDVYMIQGWGALRAIERDLLLAHPEDAPGEASGGVPTTRWNEVRRFFVYCRNTLALMIANALLHIESLAASRVVLDLSQSAILLADAWNSQFRITREVQTSSAMDIQVELVTYRFGNVPLMRTVFLAVSEIVDQRVAFERAIEDIAEVRQAITDLDHPSPRQGGMLPPAAFAAAKSRLRDKAALLDGLAAAARDYEASLKQAFAIDCPFGLLVVDSLRPGFDQPALEAALGEALWSLYARIDELGRGIDALRPLTADVLSAALAADRGGNRLQSIQDLDVKPEGPAGALMVEAFARAGDDPRALVVLHEPSWRALLTRGSVEKDSFDHVVIHHTLRELETQLEQQDRQARQTAAFFSSLARLSAALGIVLLATPAAEAYPLLAASSTIANAAVMAYQIGSVTRQLASLEQSIANRLVQADAFSGPALQRVGELIFARSEYAAAIEQQLLVEFVMTMASGTWPALRRALITRGFLQDVETLIGGDLFQE